MISLCPAGISSPRICGAYMDGAYMDGAYMDDRLRTFKRVACNINISGNIWYFNVFAKCGETNNETMLVETSKFYK